MHSLESELSGIEGSLNGMVKAEESPSAVLKHLTASANARQIAKMVYSSVKSVPGYICTNFPVRVEVRNGREEIGAYVTGYGFNR